MRSAKAGTTSKSPCSVYRVRLQIRRLGGIAGVRLRTELDTAKLPAEQANRVEGAVRGLAERPPSAPPHPDAFRYEITQLEDPDSPVVSIEESNVPPDLTGLIEHLDRTGEIEGRKPHPG
jgi:hypothetical protein